MSSGNKYFFDCNKCNNTFESSLDHIKQKQNFMKS